MSFMFVINKKIGETPLESISRFKEKIKSVKNQKLSYIGRLDPMASGKMIVISGDENNNREKYLNFDKEYFAEFVFGISTDSMDSLGLVMKEAKKNISNERILNIVRGLKKIKIQKYPWMSGKTMGGRKMFEIFKSGEIKGLKRPLNKIKIKEISEIKVSDIDGKKLLTNIVKNIKKVNGDFRQKEIIEKWKDVLGERNTDIFKTVSFKVSVSSGTFIRSFSEYFENKLKMPNFLHKLKRTFIFHF